MIAISLITLWLACIAVTAIPAVGRWVYIETLGIQMYISQKYTALSKGNAFLGEILDGLKCYFSKS